MAPQLKQSEKETTDLNPETSSYKGRGKFAQITADSGRNRTVKMLTMKQMFTHWCECAKLLQSCPVLCDHMDYGPPVSSVLGILQAGILEWVTIPSSRRSSQTRDRTGVSRLLHWQASSLPLVSHGKPSLTDGVSLNVDHIFLKISSSLLPPLIWDLCLPLTNIAN